MYRQSPIKSGPYTQKDSPQSVLIGLGEPGDAVHIDLVVLVHAQRVVLLALDLTSVEP
jgi:hypothetical protein